jgi:hypothetical protein
MHGLIALPSLTACVAAAHTCNAVDACGGEKANAKRAGAPQQTGTCAIAVAAAGVTADGTKSFALCAVTGDRGLHGLCLDHLQSHDPT